ncbi:S-layer homology domain-containing protein [Fervidobacterium sp. 2310opik-2]|uniref:S-layer homology domain-containing protein n=1 Tax=Fervidobacterium sp. 2310opik-2 TaxID=1755815 RepID=UPI0013E04BF9|nr:S-layer homology domain-containing protein [Fervidobacterium sp. 2310opik-2]KAF2961898.1 hypothetical protein AS161_07350 [Fervidobacterium sp. 2310opik-2]
MKKFLTVISILSFIVTAMAAFRDIPKGHWAENYVERLEQIGIVTGFPDGTYRGDEAVTRYQIALFISRTLDYVEQSLSSLKTQLNENKGNIENLENTIQDMKLTLELHDQDIIKLYDLVTQLGDKFVYTDEEGNQQEINLVELKEDIASISDILNGLAAQLGDVDYLLRKAIEDLDKKTSAKDDELSNSISDLTEKTDELETRVLNIENTLETGLPVLRDAIYGLSEDLANAQEALKTYTDVIAENLQNQIDEHAQANDEEFAKVYEAINNLQDMLSSAILGQLDEHAQANDEEFAKVYEAINNLQDMLSSAILGQQEEIAGLSTQLDKLNELVVNFNSETNEKISVLDERLGLLENQVASLSQVVEEVKADKSDVEEINKELAKKATKEELEQAKTIATWGVVTGVSGLLIGIIALGKAFGWF